jgi:hypothetical protein
VSGTREKEEKKKKEKEKKNHKKPSSIQTFSSARD